MPRLYAFFAILFLAATLIAVVLQGWKQMTLDGEFPVIHTALAVMLAMGTGWILSREIY